MLRPLRFPLCALWCTFLLLSNGFIVQAQSPSALAPPIRLQVSADVSQAAGQPTVLHAAGEQAPSALAFDGVDDVVRIPDAATPTQSAHLQDITNTFTVEAWVWPTAPHEIDRQDRSGTAGTGGQRYLIFPENGASGAWGAASSHAGMGISVGTNGVSVYEHTSNYMPAILVWQGSLNGWTHVAVVYQGKVPLLYINGRLVARGLWGGVGAVHPSLSFGGGSYGYFQGGVAGVRLWNTARTAAQIQQSQLFQVAATNPALVGDWRLTEGQGNVAADFGPGHLIGQLTTDGGTAATGPIWLRAPASATPLSYQWSPAPGLSSTTGASVTASPTQTTVYTVAASSGQANSLTRSTVTVSVEAPCPAVPLTVTAPQTIAPGDAVSLHATASLPGAATTFDGLADLLLLPSPAASPTSLSTTLTNTFTVEGWVKPTAIHQIDPQSGNSKDGVSGQRYLLFPAYEAGNNLGDAHAGMGISVGTNGVSVYEHASEYMPPLLVWQGDLTAWTHLAVVYQDRVPSLYINGVFVKQGVAGNRPYVHPAYEVGIGAYGSYQGSLHELRIWGTARTAAQVAAAYQQSAAGDEDGLAGCWHLDEGTGTVAHDATAAHRDGELSLAHWQVPATAPALQPVLRWSPTLGLSAATGETVTAQPSQTITYTVKVANGSTCAATQATVTVTVKGTKPLPPFDPDDDLNRNWTLTRTYDLAGNITSESKRFADAMGRPTQSQAKNLAEHHVFATQTLNNTGGVAVLSTLPAPTNNQEFKYKTGFVTATTTPAGGSAPVSSEYTASNFEKPTGRAPDPLDETTPGTLGYYYSQNNTWEPATAATHNPYSLSEPLPGPLGGMRRAAGPGDAFALESGHEGKGREFPLLNELDHYSQLRALFIPGSATPSLRAQGLKSVSINPNGVEALAFTNREGQALASCLSGDQYPASTLTGALDANPDNTAGQPLYQDLHIAASATPTPLTITDAGNGAPIQFVLIDLSKNPLVETAYSGAQSLSLAPGFYRLQVTAGRLSFSCPVHYGNFSYVFYDDAGRAVASIAPKGVAELLPTGLDKATVAVPNFVTRNVFDTAGRLLSTTTPDEGTTRYVYARDGRIRFSQSALQARPASGSPRFSYSNYDPAGRVVESGEYTQSATAGQGFVFEDMLTDSPAANSVLQAALLEERAPAGDGSNGRLDLARCAQRNQVWYDLPQPAAALGSRQQEFVLGAVAKTSKDATTTWYSYDDRGQLTWLVQQAPVVGTKTVDYTYDAAGNVLKVAYQAGQPDAFYHYYTYDANQRLTTVATSPDGVAQTVQARYFYYLHGPLKRVETAGSLQGTDYTYTVQGWLKSINGANRHLDGDSPKANGFTKDLFGLTLDYFAGDYRSAQPGLATPTIAAAPATRYDGLVRSAAWFTAANPAMRQHLFTYDAKGQLQQADFGQLLPGSTPLAAGTFAPSATRAYEEGNLRYDLNGNIQTLRRRDGVGVATDDFTYSYTPGTNKLAAVNNPAGAAVLDYDYDALGQMTRQKDEKGQRYLTYDVTGKVTGVYRDAAHAQPLVVFTYDDRGFRASKASYDPITYQLKKTTYSVRDLAGNELSTYEQPAATPGAPVLRSEVPLYGASRLGTLTRLSDGSQDYRYELTDQLGNARVIFHKPPTTTYLATMEPGAASQEEKDFTNVASTRFAAPGHGGSATVARLGITNGLSTGPSKTLAVQQGDTVTFTAYAWLTAAAAARTSAQPATSSRVVPLVGLAAPPPPGAAPAGPEQARASAYPPARVTLGAAITVGASPAAAQAQASGTATGNARLHYTVRDAAGALVVDDYQYASGGTPGTWQQLQVGLRLAQGGTVELHVETDGASGQDVYFDDVQLVYTASTIVQEQHSSAYGAPLTGLSYVIGTKRYRHGYQGQYAEKDEETGTDDFELRNYDARIGRWTAPDPAGQYHSPYVGMGNNPVSGVDPDGGFMGFATGFTNFLTKIGLGSTSGAGVYSFSVTAKFALGAANVGIGAASNAVRAEQQGPGHGVGLSQAQVQSYITQGHPASFPDLGRFSNHVGGWGIVYSGISTAAIMQGSKATIGNNWRLYPNGFRGNQHVRTMNVGKFADGAGLYLSIAGTALDAVGVYRYYKYGSNAKFTVHPAQGSANLFMTGWGSFAGAVGMGVYAAPVGAVYFLGNFAPASTNSFGKNYPEGWPGLLERTGDLEIYNRSTLGGQGYFYPMHKD